MEIVNRSQVDWNNQRILQKNREPSRVDFYPYEDLESAKARENEKNSRIEVLNGEWSFEWFDCPWKVTTEKINKKVTENDQKIQVPMNWQYAGFGDFCYANLLYPFPVDPPFVPNQNETGLYRRSFYVSNLDEKLFIRFEGVESAFHVYVNGKQVGYSQGSRLPSEFDLSDYVRLGNNQLAVVVYQYSDGSYLEDQDMWWLGGIIRDVLLIHRPQCYLKNCILDPDFDVETGEGVLNPQIVLSEDEAKILLEIWDSEDKKIAEYVLEEGKCTIRIKDVLPWTAETPVLYVVTMQILDWTGVVTEVISQKIGFRKIEINNGILQLNGRKIFMRGVNRHEYNPKTGRAITKEQIYQELLMIKEAGCNAIRCSHYPNQSYFYEVCDEIGIYVIDECDLETHGLEAIGKHKLLCENLEWQPAYLDRLERMVSRDRNHACVIVWSLGNEASFGENFRAMYRWCKANEGSRPIHYEGDFKNQIVDISSTMYSTIGELKELDMQLSPKRPHILCEFGHAMGNGPGSLKEYCEVCENSERIQGMFVWEFKDHGVESVDENGKVYYKFGGEFGETFHSGNFCMDGLVRSDGEATPGFWEYSKLIQPIRVEGFDLKNRIMYVKNKFDFIDLAAFVCKASVLADGELKEELYINLQKIGSRCVEKIELPEVLFSNYGKNQLVTLKVEFISKSSVCHRKDNGWKVGTAGIVLQDEKAILTKQNFHAPNVELIGDVIRVFGENFSLDINLADGRIHNYRKNQKLFVESGPLLNYIRPYTDNDQLNKPHWDEKHLHSMQMNVSNIEYKKGENDICIYLEGKFSPKAMDWGTNITIRYCITGNGEIGISIHGTFYGDTPSELPKIGTQVEIPNEFSLIKWRGLGPEECYCDSHEAQLDGVWEKNVEDMGFEYSCPQENGNRTKVRWIAMKNEAGQGIVVSTNSWIDMSARSHDDTKIEKAIHNSELKKDKDKLYLNLDYKNSGLGSGSCGPSAMTQYKVFPVEFEWEMLFKAFDVKEKDINCARNAQGILEFMIENRYL